MKHSITASFIFIRQFCHSDIPSYSKHHLSLPQLKYRCRFRNRQRSPVVCDFVHWLHNKHHQPISVTYS